MNIFSLKGINLIQMKIHQVENGHNSLRSTTNKQASINSDGGLVLNMKHVMSYYCRVFTETHNPLERGHLRQSDHVGSLALQV